MMDPQEELFIGLVQGLTDLGKKNGFGVYDGALPPDDGTPYPFVYLADTQQVAQGVKGGLRGTVEQTIKVWVDSPKKRGTLSRVLGLVKDFCQQYTLSASCGWILTGISQTILPDNSTATPLMQGILYVDFAYIR